LRKIEIIRLPSLYYGGELTTENAKIAEKTPLKSFAGFVFFAVNFRSFVASPRQDIRGETFETMFFFRISACSVCSVGQLRQCIESFPPHP
jgi:hypothetical protein